MYLSETSHGKCDIGANHLDKRLGIWEVLLLIEEISFDESIGGRVDMICCELAQSTAKACSIHDFEKEQRFVELRHAAKQYVALHIIRKGLVRVGRSGAHRHAWTAHRLLWRVDHGR